jgi:hypothetical protein
MYQKWVCSIGENCSDWSKTNIAIPDSASKEAIENAISEEESVSPENFP